MALISVVQNEVVERRKLLKHEDMLDGVSLATILPAGGGERGRLRRLPLRAGSAHWYRWSV